MLSSSSPSSPGLVEDSLPSRKAQSSQGKKPRQSMLFCVCSLCGVNPKPCSSHVHLHSEDKTQRVAEPGKCKQTGQFPDVPPGAPKPGTHSFFLPQPPKAPLKIQLLKCNLTTWPQSGSSGISLGLSEVFTFACAKGALGNIIARGRSGLSGTRKSFSTRTKSPGWCPRQYTAQWELLRVYRFTQPHQETPVVSARNILATLKRLLQYERLGKMSCE